jgi:maltoporin
MRQTVVVPYNGVENIDLGTGLTNIAWHLSSTAAVSYMLLETEEWAKMEAANLFDADEANDKPVAASVCLNMYGSAASRDSVPVDPSRAYTFLVFNDDSKKATVSGETRQNSKPIIIFPPFTFQR